MRLALLSICFVAACNLALGLEEAEIIETGEPCGADGECDDGNPCTVDRCLENVCVREPNDGALEQVVGDCQLLSCTDGQAASTPDDADVPNDMNECTDDVCQAGVPSNPAREGQACTAMGGKICNEDGDCVECISNQECIAPDTCFGGGMAYECGCTHNQECGLTTVTCGFLDTNCGGLDCSNGIMDGTETDEDCGGITAPNSTCNILCEAGRSCMVNTDCVSNNCNNLVCE